MDCGASDAIQIVECLGKVTRAQARYSMCFNTLVEEFDQEKEKLEANIVDMEKKVEKSLESTVEVGSRYGLELKSAKDLIREVDELQKQVEAKKTYCYGRCPDLYWQDRVGRKVENMTAALKTLNAQFQPQQMLSHTRSLIGMEYYSSENFIPFESRVKASKDILKALEDPNIHRIGLYGMGGCGKTSLVKEMGKEAEKLFKKVVFVTVSSSLEVKNVQQSIAAQLNLTLKEGNEPERARRLYMRLSGSEKILIILDDVWEELDFNYIGIPCDDNHKGCKILLTTRYRVVCASLKCREVTLGLLSEEEAWQLFQKHAEINEVISEKSLKGLPRVINRACKGLPIAVAAFAKALKKKDDLDDWKDTYDLLKRCQQVDIENKSEDPYESLKFSYDRLKEKATKDLFLLCSLFPEDSEIRKEDLIRMATGLGLFENISSCNDARREGRRAIGKLLDSFLLLQAKEGMSVKLHDILRAVALRIAGKQIQTITEPTMPPSLMESPEHVAFEEIKKLYCHCMNEFPLQFRCPKLEILIVCKDGKGSPEVPDAFFNEMGGLKVLIIIDKSLWQTSTLMLPKSVWSLKCLRTLCIRGCRLDFKFSLQQLENLKILEFCDCSIMQLPNDIAELKKLKLLDFSRCRVGGNPYKVLGNCPELEELYFSEIDLEEEELKDQNLAEFFVNNDYLTKLKRYRVQLGARVNKLKDDLKSGFLSIRPYSDQDTSTSNRAIKDLAQRAEVLFLENIPRSVENVIPHIVYNEGGCINDLTELLLCNSEGIKYLIDTTLQLNQIGTVLSYLHKLTIAGMKYLESFCNGEPPCGLFEQLKELECSQLPVLSSLGKPKLCNLLILKLESCPKLEYLFTPTVAVSLVLLEELKITKCHGLMFIIGDDKEEDITDDIDQKTYAFVFKKLKELVVGDCSELEYLIPLSFARGLENLEVLKIYLAPNLKYAFGKYNHAHQLCDQNQNETKIINFPILKVLELINLDEIISIFPKNYNVKFPDKLESHIADNCPHLEAMKSTDSPKVESEVEVQVHVQQDDYPPRKAKLFLKPLDTSVVAENIKEWVYAPILRQARYSLSFNRYVENLRTEIETLKFTTASLQDRAKGQTPELDSDVKGWLVNADALIKGAEKLEQKAIANNNCCFGHFPNWCQRYRIGKQAARKTNALIVHNRNREFPKFSQSASLMEDCFKEDFILFDSRKSMYYSLLESLKEEEISMIGLHGTGGCGKSTLAKQVAKEADQLFDRVVFVVSSNPDVRKIQEKIARSLHWPLNGVGKFERAKSLFRRLSSGERILIILDNVQNRLNLEDIGIPFGVNHKGCNVLIITRSKQVCIMMDCQRMFHLLPLRDEEAWFLLQRHAHITEDTNGSLKDVAKEVIQGCERLPVAIAIVGSTLKGKTEDDWKEALEMLQSLMDNEADLGGTYKCFKVSYYNLADENAKSLFLLCSIFPEDFEIDEEHLMRYGILLGLFGEVSSYARARDQVREAKEKLIDSCLLLKEDEGQCVKMHGVFRDAALSIANKEIVTLDGIQEWQSGNSETIRYLWCENAYKFPNELYFPKLEFLYLGLENPILPDEFFKGMKFLRVLVLYSYFPKKNLNGTILSLPNLVGLFLEGWKLGDISSVVRLHRLEALILRNCSFNKIPNEITELRKLRLLELSNCMILTYSYQAIGRCLQLQELYLTGNSLSHWNYRGENGDAFFLENEICQKLERYRIQIGVDFRVFQRGDFSTSRSLSHDYFDASTSNTAVKSLVQRAEVLSLGNISGGCENIIPDMVQKIGEGINELIELHLWRSDEIKFITDTTDHVGAFFPCLTKLEIDCLKHMEALCSGPIPGGSFEKLKELRLSNCQSIKSLFSVAVSQSLDAAAEKEIIAIDDKQNSILAFPNLEELDVRDCDELEYLGGHWLLNLCSLKVVNVADCSNLKSLFTPSTAKTMTSLEKLSLEGCDSLKEAFGVPYGKDDQELTLPRLKMLRFTNLPTFIEVSHGFKLQHIIIAELDDCPNFIGFQNSSQGQNPDVTKLRIRGSRGTEGWFSGPNPATSFERLKELEFCKCPSLESLFTGAIAQSLQTLQVLKIIKCDRLKHIIRNTDGDSKEETFTTDDDPQSVLAFPKLQKLYVEECRELKYLGGHWLLNLLCLNVLSVNCCSSLESLFTTSSAKIMTSLEVLHITKCFSLKAVFGVPYSEDIQALTLPKLKKLMLKELPNLIEVSHGFKLQRVINVAVDGGLAMFLMPKVDFPSSLQHESPDEITFFTDTISHVRAFFPLLTKLTIRRSHSLESLCRSPTPASSFEKLKELEFYECPSLKLLFTIAAAHNLKMLQVMRIIKCDKLKHIIWDANANTEMEIKSTIAFPKLKQVTVQECDNLEYLGGRWLLNLFSLNVLSVNSCSSLKSLFTTSTAKTMTSLEELRIRKCVSLKAVFGVPYRDDVQALTLPQLKKLTLKELPNLIEVSHGFKLQRVINVEVDGGLAKFLMPKVDFPSSLQHESPDEITFITDTTDHVGAFFPWISKLTIRNSKSMKSLCCGPTPASSFEKLKELELKDCSSLKSLFTEAVAQNLEMLQVLRIFKCDTLKHIVWDGDEEAEEEIISTNDDQKRLIKLCNLKVLEVKRCSSLESLFTHSIAKTMISLETLFIERCTSLKEVFGVPHGDDVQALTLPSLKMLRFIELPNLIEVSRGFKLQHAIDAEVDNCPNLRVLVDGFQNSSQGQKSGDIKYINDTTVRVGAFFRLTKLRIQGSHGTEGWLCSPTQASSFERIKELEFCECPSLESLFTVAVAQSVEMLEVLKIIKCDRLKHIIRYADGDSKEETFTTNDDQQTVLAFTRLRKLYVEECGELEYLGGHVLLNLFSLNVLSVNCCSSLKSLFTTSTAKLMTSLEELRITKCVSLKEVFGVPYSEDVQELTLPKLKKLMLKELPNLIEVSHGFKLQRVINVEVDDRLAKFLMPKVDFPSSLQHKSPDEITFFTDTIGHVRAFFPLLTKLTIRRSHSLESLCRSPTPANSFEKLKELEFYECPSLKLLFTIAVAHNLKTLQVMRIIKCDKLKHIIWDANANTEMEIKSTIAFPKLKQLTVQECDDLEYLEGHRLLNLFSLNVLSVNCCLNLKSLLTTSTAKTMTSLEELRITKCVSLKEVFGVPYSEDAQELTLPKLKKLMLKELPNLIEVSHGFKLQRVINVEVNDRLAKFPLPKVENPDEITFFTDTICHVRAFFPLLTKLTIRRSHSLESLCCIPTPASSFEKLKELEFYECPSLKLLFTIAVAHNLKMLQDMRIIKCDKLKHIIWDANANTEMKIKSTIAFPKLKQLTVQECDNLEYLGGHRLLNLFSLNVLSVNSCSSLKSLFTTSTAKTMTSLEELRIRKCVSLKAVFGVPYREDVQAVTLPQLRKLTLTELPNLIEVSNGFKLQRVINVEVDDCLAKVPIPKVQNPDEITFITDTTDHVGAFFPWISKLTIRNSQTMKSLCCGPTPTSAFEKLKELELKDCSSLKSLFTEAVAQNLEMLQVLRIFKCDTLKHIVWDGDGEAEEEIISTNDDQKRLIKLCNLKVLEVKHCSSLESLFTPSIAKTMISLETLFIERCTSLKEVFGVPHGDDVQALTLPSLKMLRFIELPNLIEVSRGFKLQHAIDAEVDNCPNLRVLVDGFQNSSQGQKSGDIKYINDTTVHVGAFFRLIKSRIRGSHGTEGWLCSPAPASSFERLKELEFCECPSLESLFTVAVAQSVEKLQVLKIIKCDRLKHIIRYANGDSKEETFTANDDQQSVLAFTKLRQLYVEECGELEYLGGHRLLNLFTLNVLSVNCCLSLKSLFTTSTAKTMTSLEELRITNCVSLREVFGVPYSEDVQALTLPQLKKLMLKELPNLIEVSPGFKLQRVINVEVDDRLAKFPIPKVKNPDEIIFIADTTDHVGPFFSWITKLTIRNSHSMKSLCCGPTPAWSFERLKELEFCKCPSLESLFTVAVAQSLEMLQVLKIIKCDRLKHIIRYADGDSKEETFTADDDQQNVLTFPKLQNLYVKECGELEYLGGHWSLNLFSLNVLSVNCCLCLKSLFTTSTAKTMMSLVELSITKCVSLTEVFGVPYSEDVQALTLPQLKKLTLKELPSLIEVSHGFKLQRVINVEVDDRLAKFPIPEIQNPDEIIFITDTTDHVGAFFPWITKLTIRNSHSLKSLCCGPTPARSFERLNKLEVCKCPSLESLFTVGVAQSLEMLQVLKIIKCDRLKHIIRYEDGDSKKEAFTTDDYQQSVLAFPKLRKLYLEDCGELEYLGGHWILNLCSLEELDVRYCSSLEWLFTPSTAKTMMSLEVLIIEKCSSLKKVFGVPYGENDQALTLPGLRMLRFKDLPELIEVSHGFKLQHVIDAVVKDCPKFCGPFDYFLNLSDDEYSEQYSESESEELYSEPESEEEGEDKDVIGQSPAKSQESSEVHNALAGTSNLFNTASSSASTIKGTANEEPTLQTVKEPVQVQEILKFDKNVRGINSRKVEDSKKQEFERSSDAENAAKQTTKESVHAQVPISGKYSGGKDSDSQTATSQDVDLNDPLEATKSNYQTREERGNQKKTGEMNVIEQSTTQTEIPLSEMIIGVREHLQTEGLHSANNPIGGIDKLKEHQIPPIGSLHLKESIGERTMGSAQKSLPSERSTKEISSLELVESASNIEPISMDHQDEAIEENKVSTSKKFQDIARSSLITQSSFSTANAASTVFISTSDNVSPGNMRTAFDYFRKQWEDSYKGPREEGKHEHPLDNVNTEAGSSGKATLELPSTVQEAQTVHTITLASAPIQAPVSSVSHASVHAQPPEGDLMMRSSNEKLVISLEEEYAAFRDIVEIKKKHIPLLEQAIESYPSLWAWQETHMHPKMKQFGYAMLGDMLEFLASTKWRDLREQKKAEFELLLDGLEKLGFDTQWLANTCAQIKQRKTINRMKMLEQQAVALECELDGIRDELEKFNKFIGF